jgi:hypothetical protein
MQNSQHPSTPEPLHDTVLRIAFLANTERPQMVSTEDIYWKLDNPNMLMSSLKEVLEWLVRRGDIEKDLGKYRLSPARFFELKEENRHLVEPKWRFFMAPIAPIKIPQNQPAEPTSAANPPASESQTAVLDEKQLATLKSSLRTEVEDGLISLVQNEIVPELKESLKASISAELHHAAEPKTEVKSDQEADLKRWNGLKTELKGFLRDEVGAEIQEKLKQDLEGLKANETQAKTLPEQLEILKEEWHRDLKTELIDEFQKTLSSHQNPPADSGLDLPSDRIAIDPIAIGLKAEIKKEMRIEFSEYLLLYTAELQPKASESENLPIGESHQNIVVGDRRSGYFPMPARVALVGLLLIQTVLLIFSAFQLSRFPGPAGSGSFLLGLLVSTTLICGLLVFLYFRSFSKNRPQTKESQP